MLRCWCFEAAVTSNLDDGDDGDEDRWRTQAVLVEVPAPVCLAGQYLVGHIADEAFVQTQARLVQQDLPLQRAATVGYGSSETAGAFAAHLRKAIIRSSLSLFLTQITAD